MVFVLRRPRGVLVVGAPRHRRPPPRPSPPRPALFVPLVVIPDPSRDEGPGGLQDARRLRPVGPRRALRPKKLLRRLLRPVRHPPALTPVSRGVLARPVPVVVKVGTPVGTPVLLLPVVVVVVVLGPPRLRFGPVRRASRPALRHRTAVPGHRSHRGGDHGGFAAARRARELRAPRRAVRRGSQPRRGRGRRLMFGSMFGREPPPPSGVVGVRLSLGAPAEPRRGGAHRRQRPRLERGRAHHHRVEVAPLDPVPRLWPPRASRAAQHRRELGDEFRVRDPEERPGERQRRREVRRVDGAVAVRVERRERRPEHRVRVRQHHVQTLRDLRGPDEPERPEQVEQVRHDAMHELAAVGALEGRGSRAGRGQARRAIPELRRRSRRRRSGPDAHPHAGSGSGVCRVSRKRPQIDDA